MIIVGRYIEDITSNALEYLLDENGEVKKFTNAGVAKRFLRSQGFSDDDLCWFVFETVGVSGEDTEAKLENAARYIVKKISEAAAPDPCYTVDADDFHEGILPPELFTEHIETIARMMRGYESIAEAEVVDESISVVLYLDCLFYASAYGGNRLRAAA
jgi:hypothetical protein